MKLTHLITNLMKLKNRTSTFV